jgi:hypothetical protein
MTKKSQGRVQRDAAKAQVKAEAKHQGIEGIYDSLNVMHRNQMSLFEQYRNLVELLTNKEIIPFYADIERVNLLMRGLDVDLGDLMDKVAANKKLHEGKTGYGNPEDEDEYFHTMQIQQNYMVFMGVHQQVLLPMMLELDDHLNRAVAAKQAAHAQALATANALDQQPLAQVPAEAPVTETAIAAANPYEQPAINV